MEQNTKDKVLMAIYIEYQKDIPNMDANITTQSLGIELEALGVAIEKLANEELIILLTPATYAVNRASAQGDVSKLKLKGMLISKLGIEYVKENLLTKNS